MKVIKIDNFNRESVSDQIVCEGCNEYYADLIATMLNEKFSGNQSPDFFKAVPNDYKLYQFEP